MSEPNENIIFRFSKTFDIEHKTDSDRNHDLANRSMLTILHTRLVYQRISKSNTNYGNVS
jgi:hypothetical protein